MIEIDKGIPLLKARNAKYPFRAMLVGDSFFVPDSSRKTRRLITNNAVAAAKRIGFKFSVRLVEGGVRCWRVA